MNNRTPLNKRTPWTKNRKNTPKNSHNLESLKCTYSKYQTISGKNFKFNKRTLPNKVVPPEKFPKINKRTGTFI